MKTLLSLVLALMIFSGVTAQKLSADQQAAKKVVVDFFKWYRNNSEKINSFKLYKGKKSKDVPPYIIDWREAEKYFSYIRKSVPFLGETFIENEKKNFKEIQLSFNQNPEDEIPIGFDYDRFTGGQESAEYMIDDWLLSKKTTIEVKVNGNAAGVYFISYLQAEGSKKEKQTSVVELVKEKGQWKISKNISEVI